MNWISVHMLLLTAIVGVAYALGTAASIGAKYATAGSKLEAFLEAFAGATLDGVKVVDNLLALLGKPPTMMTRRKLKMRGPFDNDATVPTVNLRGADATRKTHVPQWRFGFLQRIGFALALSFAISFLMLACAKLGADIAPTVNATIAEANCVSAKASNANETFEDLVVDCELPSITLAEQLVQDAIDAFGQKLADGAVGLALPPEQLTKLRAIHHADGGAK